MSFFTVVTSESDSEPALVTKRLILEPLVVAHAAALFGALRDEALYSFIPQDPPTSIAALTARLERLATRRSPDGSEAWLNWAARRSGDGEYVGTVQATVYPDRTAHIAYTVFGRFQRLGYAAEACRALLGYLERDVGVVVVVAEIDTRNLASIALVERLGFVRISTTIDADYFKGSTSHEHRYERRQTGQRRCA